MYLTTCVILIHDISLSNVPDHMCGLHPVMDKDDTCGKVHHLAVCHGLRPHIWSGTLLSDISWIKMTHMVMYII
jgi:hypothetical protein